MIFSAEELIDLDAKSLDKNGVKFVIAQVNTVSIEDVLKRKAELENAINEKNKQRWIGFICIGNNRYFK